MPHHFQQDPLSQNSLNYIVGTIGAITENSVSDLTLLGVKESEH